MLASVCGRDCANRRRGHILPADPVCRARRPCCRDGNPPPSAVKQNLDVSVLVHRVDITRLGLLYWSPRVACGTAEALRAALASA